MGTSGIIFDCDGTLVDSMPMWDDSFPSYVRAHGGVLSDEVFSRIVDTHLASRCMRVLNQEFGFCDSDEDFIEEFYGIIRDHYANDIHPFPGASEFIEQVRAAGIPFVIATGTRSREILVCLEANGIEVEPEQVLSCEDDGVGKDHDNIFRRAIEALGAPVSELWMFDDEACALKTARSCGLRTVCVHKPGDSDPEELRPLCDVLWEGWGEADLASLLKM